MSVQVIREDSEKYWINLCFFYKHGYCSTANLNIAFNAVFQMGYSFVLSTFVGVHHLYSILSHMGNHGLLWLQLLKWQKSII